MASVRDRMPERCSASNWRAEPRGKPMAEEAEADESWRRILSPPLAWAPVRKTGRSCLTLGF